MAKLIAIKKTLPDRSVTAFTREDNKHITINISRTDYESQYKKAEKRLNDIISVLFEEAIKAEEKIVSTADIDTATAISHEARALFRVMKRLKLWDGYARYKTEMEAQE